MFSSPLDLISRLFLIKYRNRQWDYRLSQSFCLWRWDYYTTIP